MFNLSNVIRDVSQCNKILFYLIEKKKNIYESALREHLQRLTIARHLTRSS